MSDRPRLRINGEEREYNADTFPKTVSALLSDLHLNPEMIVAEVNSDIIGRANFPNHELRSGDEVELVRFVGGG